MPWPIGLGQTISDEKELPGRMPTTKTLQEQYVVDAKGHKKGVILSLKRYQQLMEDLHDLAVVAERREEPTISLDELKRRLKNDRVL